MLNYKFIGSLLPILLNFSKVLAQGSAAANGSTGASATVENTPGRYYLLKNENEKITNVNEYGILAYYEKANDPYVLYYNPPPGYYLSGLADKKYIQCGAEGCKLITDPTKTTCDANIPGLIKPDENVKLCLGIEGVSVSLPDGRTDDSDTYFVKQLKTSTSPSIFNFNTNVNYYALKRNETVFILDEEHDAVDKCTLNTDGIEISRKKDFCSRDSLGKYITCDKGKCTTKTQSTYQDDTTEAKNAEGKCDFEKETDEGTYKIKDDKTCENGYHLYEKTLLKVNNEATGEDKKVSIIDEEGIFKSADKSKSYNGIIKCVNKECGYEAITLNDCAAGVYGLVDSGYNIYLCSNGSVQLFSPDDPVKQEIPDGSTEPVLVDKAERIYTKGLLGDDYYALKVYHDRMIVDDSANDETTIDGVDVTCTEGVCSLQISKDCVFTNVSNTGCRATSCDPRTYFITREGKLVKESNVEGYLVNVSSTKTCSVISKDAGFYLYGKKLINCATAGSCTIESNPNTSSDGYYLNNSNTSEVISCNTDGSCDAIAADKNRIYINGGKSLSLIECNSNGKCSTYDKGEYTYYLNKYTGKTCINDVCNDNNEPTVSFIECTDKTCNEGGTTIKGNFINGNNVNEVIICNNGSCEVSDNKLGYYIEGRYTSTGKYNLIYKEKQNSACKIVLGEGRGIYISALNVKKLIICGSEGCKESDVDTDKTYLNAGADKGNYPLLVSEGTDPDQKWKVDKAIANRFYINGNKENDSIAAFIKCSSATSCSEVDAKSGSSYIDIANRKIIKEITVNDWIEYVDIENNTAYVVNMNTNEILNDNTVVGSLIVTTNGNTAKVTSGYGYYLNSNDSSGKSIIKNVNGNISILNNPTEGFYITNASNNVISCDNNNVCEKVVGKVECNESGDVGKYMLSSSSVCVSHKETTSDTTKEAVTVVPANGKKYIIKKKLYIVTGLSSSSAKEVLVKKIIGDEYYLTVNNKKYELQSTDSSVEGSMIKCDEDSQECEIEQCIADNYYPNADTSVFKTNIYIEKVKEKDICKGVNPTNNYKVNCVNSSTKQLLFCDKCVGENHCITKPAKNGVYTTADKTKLIKCNDSSSCEEKDPEDEGYYVSQDASKPLILCKKVLGGINCSDDVTINDGYYVSHQKGFIINCKNKVCSESDGEVTGWFVSGETGKAITYCYDGNCESRVQPKTGWYINGNTNSDMKLIKCSASNGAINCEEKIVPSTNYLINAGSENVSDILIDCTYKIDENTGKLYIEGVVASNNYYVDAETNQLIYCKQNSCVSVTVKEKGWYLPVEGTELIGCLSTASKSIECKSYSQINGQISSGYYLNSDPNTSYAPLIQWYCDPSNSSNCNFKLSNYELKSGWYKNAENSESVIQCNSSTNCELKKLKSNCSSANNGEFALLNGELVWCDGSVPIKFTQKKRYHFVNYNKANFIPGLALPEGSQSAIARLSITKDSIIKENIGGYTMGTMKDASGNTVERLFLCTETGVGSCSLIDKPDDGYYVNNGSGEFKKYRCENSICTTGEINWGNLIGTDYSNFKVQTKDDREKDLNSFDVQKLYAIKSNNFPGTNGRYLLAYIDKFSVKKYDDIKEVQKCTGDVNDICETSCIDSSKKLHVCIYDENSSKKIYKGSSDDNITFGNSDEDAGIQINIDNEHKEIEYDADTNDGYFIYDGNELAKVYIFQNVTNDIFKYRCEIGAQCVRRERAEQPITGYNFADDGRVSLNRKNNVQGKEDVEEEVETVKVGYYKSSKDKEYYKCDKEENCTKTNDSEIDATEDGRLKVKEVTRYSKRFIRNDAVENKNLLGKRGESGIIESDKKRTKYIPRNIDGTTNDYEIFELTHVSYTASDEGARNIFVDTNYYIIGEEEDENNNAIAYGYVCKNDGKCSEIPKNGNYRYYLNTIQNGKPENALVKCGGTEEGSCTFEVAPTDKEVVIYHENAAATGNSDAIIICRNGSCSTTAASTTVGLPECKTSDENSNNIYMYDGTNNPEFCYNKKTGAKLEIGQHCILNGKTIYKQNDDNCAKLNTPKMMLFDATNSEINIGTVNESHYGASLYDCTSENNCYITYGFIKTNDGYLTCNSSGCISNSLNVLKNEKCSNIGAGALTKDSSGNLKLCEKSSGDGITLTGTASYYINIEYNNNFPEIKSGDKIILSVNGNVVSLIIGDGYLLMNSNNIVQTTEGLSAEVKKSLKLYQCTSLSKNCDAVSIEKGFFKAYNEKIINCSEFCEIGNTDKTFGTDKNTYYTYDSSVIWVATKHKIIPFSTNNYVLLNTNEKRLAIAGEKLSSLYKCSINESKCSEVNVKVEDRTVDDGYYISGMQGYSYIKCEGNNCEVKNDLGNKCGNKVEGEIVFKDSEYQLCVKVSGSWQNMKILENSGSSFIMGTSYNFPGNNNYIVINDGSVIGLGIIDTSDTTTTESLKISQPIQVCGTIDKSKACQVGNTAIEGYCYNIEKTGNIKIYRSYAPDGSTKKICELQYPDTTKENINYPLVKLFNGNTLVDEEVAPTVGTKMFYCTKSGCRITTGYYKYKKDSQYYRCDSIECKQGSPIEEMVVTDDEKSYKYYASSSATFPGAESNKQILVEAGEDYLVVFKADGYYLINESKEMQNEDNNLVQPTSNKRSIGSSQLYLCNSQTSDCINQNQKVTDGYFINSASELTGKSLIQCVNQNCGIAENIKNITSCADQSLGTIYRYGKTSPTFKFCLSGSGIDLSVSLTNVQYYPVTLSNGDEFGRISIKEKLDPTDEDLYAKILVEFTSKSVMLYQTEGYLLLNGKSIVENIGGSGVLYKCSNKEYNGSTTKVVQCETQTVNNGYYFMNRSMKENIYINCNGNKCVLAQAKETNECTNSGSLIYSNGSFKLCRSLNNQVDLTNVATSYKAMMTVSKITEFPGAVIDNADIMVEISKDSVYSIKLDSYFVADEYKVVIEDDIENGTLYQCFSKGYCVINTIAENNYYVKTDLMGNPVHLIYCEDQNKCKNVLNPEVEFYVNANKSLIQCMKPGYYNSEEEKYVDGGKPIECYEREMKEGYFKQANENGKIIECNLEKGCRTVETVIDGWYLNNAYKESIYSYSNLKNSNTTQYPLIRCEGGNCQIHIEKLNSKCSKTGEFILTNNVVKFCTNANKSVDLSNSSNIFVNIENANDFLSNLQDIVGLSINKYSVTLLNGNGFYASGSGSSLVMYYCEEARCTLIKKDTTISGDKKIVKDELTGSLYTGKCTDEKCSWTIYSQEGIVFVNNDNEIIRVSSEEDTISIDKIYKCRKNNSKNVCVEIPGSSGYYYNNEAYDKFDKLTSVIYKYDNSNWSIADITNIRNCTNYKQNTCYISYANEPYIDDNYDEKYKIRAGELCRARVNNADKYYLAIDEINTGIDKENCIMLPTDNSINYYNVDDKVYLMDKYSIYQYSTYEDSKKVINGLDSKPLFSQGYDDGIYRSDNLFENTLLTCKDEKCSVTNIVSCTYEYQTGKCKLSSSGSLVAGQVCISERGITYITLEKISNTANGNCTPYKDSYSLYSSEGEVQNRDYYVNVNNVMYSIDSSSNVRIHGEGIYILNNSNKLSKIVNKMNIKEGSPFKLFVCNNEGCKQKTSCSNGIMNEFMYDGKYGIIKCDPNSNTISILKSEGYFVNTPWNNLIKCYSDTSCKVIDNKNGMEGYYIDKGNEGNIIKCFRTNNKFICKSEEIVTCNYVEKDGKGKCSSNVDLLRNSYCIENNSQGKLIYVENFIKSGDIGNCQANDGNDYYYKYSKSKFLGYQEREDLIKFTSNYIVSIYEDDVGYYIINTENGKGVTENVNMNKTRMYECRKSSCVEVKPKEVKTKEIYINKASKERLILKENDKSTQWNVLKHGCNISKENILKCILFSEIKAGDIFYTETNEVIKFRAVQDNNIKGSTKQDYHKIIDSKKYHLFDHGMYILNENKQSLSIQKEEGYYIFKTGDKVRKEEGSVKSVNLEPYISTVNVTVNSDSDIIVYQLVNDSWKTGEDVDIISKEGYYWNKADIDGLGIIVQVMDVPEKTKPKAQEDNKRRKRSENVETLKVVRNKCTSNVKNKCVAVDGTILKGSACVVLEGKFKGLYYAYGNIMKGSSSENCIKYDEDNVYQYIPQSKEKTEFAGEPHEKILLRIGESSITPFTAEEMEEEMDSEYWVFGSDWKYLNSAVSVDANAYKCENRNINEDSEDVRFECNTIDKPSEYYYVNKGYVVKYSKGQWNNVSDKNYYFMNKDNLGASYKYNSEGKEAEQITHKYPNNLSHKGYYLNSATSRTVVVYFDSDNSVIYEGLKNCTITKNVCAIEKTDKNEEATDTLKGGDICYSNKKLYVVVENSVEEKDAEGEMKSTTITNCYTGSTDKLKYTFFENDNNLYEMDGITVKSMNQGYYILNENMEEFSSNYPVKPYLAVKCSNGCNELNENNINDNDVVVNMAGTGANRLMKYYANGNKFVNVKQPGYYFFNSNYEVPSDSSADEELKYEYVFTVNNDGTIIEQTISEFYENNSLYKDKIAKGDIVINYAKPNDNVMVENGEYYNNEKILIYNKDLDLIEYGGKTNENESKNVFVTYENSNKQNELFLLKPKYIKKAAEGLYATINGLPFDKAEWTELQDGTEVCYFDGNECNGKKLSSFKDKQYLINFATEDLTIIQYNKDKGWRTVKENGFYFFFEENYAVDKEDRRVSKVLQIENGVVIDVTDTENKTGFFVTNGLVIEGNGSGWTDGEVLVKNVDVSGKRQCIAYENDETIEQNEFCYNDENGVCVRKSLIANSDNVDGNCMFNNNDTLYYYLVNGKLYATSKDVSQQIIKSGIYVIGEDNVIYTSKLEGKANTYKCEDGSCVLIKNIKKNNYMNLANINVQNPIILYYNDVSKNWRKVSENGIYFFDKMGYPVTAGSEIAYAYEVKNNGNKIENITNSINNGKFISKSTINDPIIVENKKGKFVVSNIFKCTFDKKNGTIKSKSVLKIGDLCIDGKDLIFVKGAKTKAKREEEEYSYDGVSSVSKEEVYVYNEEEKKLSILNGESLEDVTVNGLVVIDADTSLPLEGVTEKNAVLYKCESGTCTLVDQETISKGSYYVNALSDDSSLVKYNGNGKWEVESNNGYYFFDYNMKPIEEKGSVSKAFEIKNGAIQIDISDKAKVGFYLNKAKGNKVLLTNESSQWSIGRGLRKCNITSSEKGPICRTFSEEEEFDKGDYCYQTSTQQIYLLTEKAVFEPEETNCIFGTNNQPKYYFIDKLNNTSINYLVKLTTDAVRKADPGYYILNVNGTTTLSNSENEEDDIKIYSCTDTTCEISSEGSFDENTRYITEDGDVFEFDGEGKLVVVDKDGLYFFNENGKPCQSEEDIVSKIVKVSEGGSKKEVLPLNSLKQGAYVNEAHNKCMAIYDGSQWSVSALDCRYDAEAHACDTDHNNGEMNVGDYCVVDGKVYVVKSVNEETEARLCIPGVEDTPVIFNVDSRLLSYKEKSVIVIDQEGYYAIESSTNLALKSDNLVSSEFIKCEYGGECSPVTPETGNYLNRAPENFNIVEFPSGNVTEAKTNDSVCTVEISDSGSKCSATAGTLESGNICIASESLYLIESDESCIKAENDVVKYQFVNKKLYKLGMDSVIQMLDGYYFINKNNQAIGSVSEYEKAGTVGYMCSIKGECYLIEPQGVKYYPDYNSLNNGKFRVIKYDQSKVNLKKRQDEAENTEENNAEENNNENTEENNDETEEDEGSSGYENIDEEGIYELDDGSYVECEFDNNDEITCKEIEDTGAKKTKDGKIIKCVENDEKEVVCSQATDGGYYDIDGTLYECEPSDEYDELVCTDMGKEGYFLAKPENELFECVEVQEEETETTSSDDVGEINNVYQGLDAEGANADGANSETELPPVEDSEPETASEASTETTSTTTEETTTTTTTEETTTTTTIVPTQTPLDVVCKPVPCVKGEIKKFTSEEGEVEMYICKNVKESSEEEEGEGDEEEKLEWVPSDCESGNFVKEGDYYTCEDDKEDVDKENIKQPNTDHTSTEKSTETTTTAKTTDTASTTSSAATTDSSSTPTEKPSSSESTTSKPTESSSTEATTTTSSTQGGGSTTTTTTTTTKSTTTATTTTAGARSIIRNIPSLTFYLILFIFSYYLFI